VKKGLLLNRALSDLVAACGHVDEIVVADAGMPAPPGVRVIDLALMRGVPSFWQVLEALRSELVIEGVVIAEETSAGLLTKMTALATGAGLCAHQLIDREIIMSNEDKFGPYVKKIGKKFYPQGRPTVRSENLWREKYWEVRREVDGKCYFETLNGAHGGGVIVYEISEEEFSAVKKTRS